LTKAVIASVIAAAAATMERIAFKELISSFLETEVFAYPSNSENAVALCARSSL
jgi:hypothetical protein